MFAKLANLQPRWRALLAGVALLILIVFFYPFKSTTVPRWRTHIIEDSGAAVAGMRVTEHWQHYLLESEGYEEMRMTDEAGMVDFPERTVRANFVMRVYDAVSALLRQGSDVKMAPYASLVIWGRLEYDTAVAIHHPGTEPKNEIIIHRR